MFNTLLAKGKALFVDLEARWSGIQSPAAKIAVAAFVAVLLAMIVWAILPWIGFFIAVGLVAFIVRLFWPNDQPRA
ncbi:hypothetical protein K663_14920 [Sphingobium sp. MI1205]|nr:hypothetical protein K663_14920 [Sphingobium sp. MI1205]